MDCQSRISTSWRFSLMVLVLLPTIFFRGECNNEQDPIVIQKESVEKWASTLGERLIITSNHYSGVQYLRKEYRKRQNELNLTRIEGSNLLENVKTKISEFLQMKVRAVKNIVETLESSIKTYNFSKTPPEEYLNAIELNYSVTDWSVEWDPRFDSQSVLLENSTIHVPTVVYNKDVELLREIEASSVLESVFTKNFERDYTLKWQYYGSKIGFMRNFPGINWTLENNLNLFDCRQRSWYSQAIAPPKTVLFLVDMSGSQTGLALGMTHLMVMNTIDSLEENDYFNIMTFNDSTKFVDECYEDTFLQATYKNKEKMKEKLKEIKPQRKSMICEALTAAFDALEEARSGPSSECSESIMLFTDGVEFPCDEVFADRNQNRTVRVFTYLLGESNQHAGILKRIACTNHGRYSRITVRSDVPEKVADYLPVLGRPLVQRNEHLVVWSNTYRDFLSSELVFTVSQIVHNTTVVGRKDGIVAGVASVDVPIQSLEMIVPPYLFGVNGYMFMITNNGFITHHPDRKSMHKGQPVEGISTQDITDVEQSQQFDQAMGSFSSEYDKFFGDFDEMQLRKDMIDRKTGETDFPVERPFDNMKRLKEVNQTYYYTEIKETPFSLAVVLTEDGVDQINPVKTVRVNNTTKKINGDVTEELKVLMNLMAKDHVKLAEWIPCWLLKPGMNESSYSGGYFMQFLQEIANDTDPGMATTICEIDWTNLLLLDLRATANFSQHWNFLYNISSTTENHENPFGVNVIEAFPDSDDTTTNTYRSGMIASFLATVGGLNQYYDISENRTEGFVHEYSNTVTEDYFARSVNDVVEDGFVYSFPPKPFQSELDMEPEKKKPLNVTTEEEEEEEEEKKIYRVSAVTAFSAVKVNDKTVAVAGHQMTVQSFADLFLNATSSCEGLKECYHHCGSKGVNCLLMDKDGYILASSDNDNNVGQHLAFVDTITFHMYVKKGIMYRRNYADYQALCHEDTPQNQQSASSFLLNPLSQMKNLVAGFVQNTILMLTTFGWYDWLMMMVLPSPSSSLGNDEVIFNPCDLNYAYYKLNFAKVSEVQEGSIPALASCDEGCVSSYVVVKVPNTNLALSVITRAGDCSCPGLEAFEFVQVVNYNTTEESLCEEAESPIYRRSPPGCVLSTPTELAEESTECGSASFLQPSWFLIALATFHLFTRCLVV